MLYQIKRVNNITKVGSLWLDEQTRLGYGDCIKMTEKEAKAFSDLLEQVPEGAEPNEIERNNQRPISEPSASGHAAQTAKLHEEAVAEATAEKDAEIADLKKQLAANG